MRPVVESLSVEEPTRGSTQRPLALAMIACGALGYLAWAYLRYGNLRPFSNALLPGLVWLSVVSIACWAVLLVRPGRRRVLVGVLATVLAMGFVGLIEYVGMQALMQRRQARQTRLDHTVPRPGERLVLPATVRDLDGKPFDLAGYGDRPIVLNVWRTWCGPCREEMPDLQQLDGRQTSLGPLAVMAVSDEPADLLSGARDQLGIRFPLIRHEEGLGVLDVDVFPTTFIVHRGRVIDRWVGTREDLTARVETAVQRASAAVSETAE